jgi:hypothetical protein
LTVEDTSDNLASFCRIWGSAAVVMRRFYLPGYKTLRPAEGQGTFSGSTSRPFSGLKRKPSKTPTRSRLQAYLLPVSHWFIAWLTLRPCRWRRYPCSSETQADFRQTARHYIPDNKIIYFILIFLISQCTKCVLSSRK